MRRLWLLAPILLCGCAGNDSPIARAAGTYPGQFAIEAVNDKSDPATLKAEEMKGSLALYATKMKYSIDMSTRHQSFTVGGHWKAEKSRITLVTDSYIFQNPTDEDQKALSLKIITADEIRAVFGHPVVLDASPDRRKLTGLKTSLGKLMGRFEFDRPIPH